jgi:hypothetical protein
MGLLTWPWEEFGSSFGGGERNFSSSCVSVVCVCVCERERETGASEIHGGNRHRMLLLFLFRRDLTVFYSSILYRGGCRASYHYSAAQKPQIVAYA